MGKAPEVDVARAQLKLLIVQGDMQGMAVYPVAYYSIVKTKDGIACKPVAQEVIGRAAFLLVYAAITFSMQSLSDRHFSQGCSMGFQLGVSDSPGKRVML